MRITVVHSESSGYETLRRNHVLEFLRKAGYEPTHVSSKARGLERKLEDPGEMIVVVGGDGTVGTVVKKRPPRDVPIAVIPAGTANNVATALGIRGTLEELVPQWSRWARRRVSLGIASGPWGAKPFLESFGVGLFASTMRRIEPVHDGDEPFESREEELRHAFREMKRLLRRRKPRHYSISLDGADHSGKFHLVEAMNLCLIGPNLWLAPGVKTEDDLLDVVFLPEDRTDHFDEYLTRRLDGEQPVPDLPTVRARQMTIDARGRILHVDDEFHSKSNDPLEGPIDLFVRPKELTFLVPRRQRKTKGISDSNGG